jgi:hypothetical protein
MAGLQSALSLVGSFLGAFLAAHLALQHYFMQRVWVQAEPQLDARGMGWCAWRC